MYSHVWYQTQIVTRHPNKTQYQALQYVYTNLINKNGFSWYLLFFCLSFVNIFLITSYVAVCVPLWPSPHILVHTNTIIMRLGEAGAARIVFPIFVLSRILSIVRHYNISMCSACIISRWSSSAWWINSILYRIDTLIVYIFSTCYSFC